MRSISDSGIQQPIFLILKSLLSLEVSEKGKKGDKRISCTPWRQIQGRTGMEPGEQAHSAEPWSRTLMGLSQETRLGSTLFLPPRDQKQGDEASIVGVWVPNSPQKIILKAFLFQGLALVEERRIRAQFDPLHAADQFISTYVLNIYYMGNTKS